VRKIVIALSILICLLIPYVSFGADVDLVPTMTSNNTPSGVASSSSSFDSNHDAWLAFDKLNFRASPIINYFLLNASTGSLSYEFSTPKVVNSYKLVAIDCTVWQRSPTAWSVDGWTGSSWVTLDSHSGVTWSSSGAYTYPNQEAKTYFITSPGAYIKYRLNITANGGNAYSGLSEFYLFGTEAPTLQSINVNPDTNEIQVGQTVQLNSTAVFSDTTTQDVTSTSTWTSSDTNIATVSSTGLVTAVTAGTVTISGNYNGQTDSCTVNVTAAPPPLTITKIEIAPEAVSLNVYTTQQLQVWCYWSDGSREDISSSVVWSSSNQNVLTVNNGLVNTLDLGSATVTAEYNGNTDTLDINVVPNEEDGLDSLGKIDLRLKNGNNLLIEIFAFLAFVGSYILIKLWRRKRKRGFFN
jgi:uncharacterized protein YjdB